MNKLIKKIFRLMGFEIKRIIVKSNPYNKYIKELGINFPTADFNWITKSIHLLNNLKKIGAEFDILDKSFVVKIKNMKYYVNSWEEVFILNEIYINGIYNFKTNREFILIDIGMNVGFTSLFFSEMKECKEIYSFEPFQRTCQFAKRNIGFNPSIKKINIHEYGLGFPSREIKVNYNEEFKGSVGINGLGDHIKTSSKTEEETIKIFDVGQELLKIIDKNQEYSIVVKIDCEGAEYEIISRLHEMKLIPRVDYFMIEWHKFGPNKMSEIFINENFDLISFNEENSSIGMIYASKRR